jgi:hypothetical protein
VTVRKKSEVLNPKAEFEYYGGGEVVVKTGEEG